MVKEQELLSEVCPVQLCRSEFGQRGSRGRERRCRLEYCWAGTGSTAARSCSLGSQDLAVGGVGDQIINKLFEKFEVGILRQKTGHSRAISINH